MSTSMRARVPDDAAHANAEPTTPNTSQPVVVEVIYENGIFRPVRPVVLLDGMRGEVHLHPAQPVDPDQVNRLLDEIAALPIEGTPDTFSGADHDSVLFPKEGSIP